MGYFDSRRKLGVCIAAAVAAAALLAGCGGKGGESSGANPDTTSAAAGSPEAIYKKQCVSCHGNQLEGRIGPKTNLTQVGARLNRDQIAAQIADGGNGMPGFKKSLSEAEIGALADWLAAKK